MITSKETLQEIELNETVNNNSESIFDAKDHVMNSDTENIITNENTRKYILPFSLSGINIIILSVVVFSFSLTVTLFFEIIFGTPQVSPRGAVVVDDPFCGTYGLKMMHSLMGNAVDAAISTILCLTVTRPDVASLMACGGMLVHERDKQESHLFDFLCSAPSSLPHDEFLPDPKRASTLVGIPGLVRGLQRVHAKFGSIKWSNLFAGAIHAAAEGFHPHPSLVASAKHLHQSNRNAFPPEFMGLITNPNSIFQPHSSLKLTLTRLANDGPAYFYNDSFDSNGYESFARTLLHYVQKSGTNWSSSDLDQFEVHYPKPLMLDFAGFTLTTFPIPFGGGPFLLLLMKTLEQNDSKVPLNHEDLIKGDSNSTAMFLHKFIELTRLTEHSLLSLKDYNNFNLTITAQEIEKLLPPFTMVRSIVDQHGFVNNTDERDALFSLFSKQEIGGTGLVTTDSKSLTVVADIFLGSPFGNGQIVTGTGVLMNSALSLFSTRTSNSSNFNLLAPNKRPLVPISPVYLSTTDRKCGIRAGFNAFPGLWGITDLAQVLSNAAFFLFNSSCTSAKQTASTKLDNHYYDAPAVTNGCMNLSKAVSSPRIYSLGQSGQTIVESSETNPVIQYLKNHGHNISSTLNNSAIQWLGRVFVVGWNGYDMIVSGDSRGTVFTNTVHSY